MQYSNTVYNRTNHCIEPIFIVSCPHYINASLQRITFSRYTILHIYLYTYNKKLVLFFKMNLELLEIFIYNTVLCNYSYTCVLYITLTIIKNLQ